MAEHSIKGYASVFDVVDLQGECIQKGSFARTLRARVSLPLMLFQHDDTQVVGKWLHMTEDRHGLWVEGVLDSQPAATFPSISRGLSIGYYVRQSRIEVGIRVIEDVDLVEVSLVTKPANPLAVAANV